jgi:hypothetical protein
MKAVRLFCDFSQHIRVGRSLSLLPLGEKVQDEGGFLSFYIPLTYPLPKGERDATDKHSYNFYGKLGRKKARKTRDCKN